MTALMERRGPDDVGYWSDQRHVMFGFRRLSIIDPTPAGHQPMVSADGRCCIAFNGELYNFRELRSELQRLGRKFRSGSDTEVALEALACWGPEALQRFNGMFALAFYDSGAGSRGELLLARDPVGIKPLYLLTVPQGVVWGSQYDQVIRHPWCNTARLDTAAVGLYLRLNYLPAPYGVFEDTSQLEPGNAMVIRPGGGPQLRSFRPWPAPRHDVQRTQDEESDHISSTVSDAVARQLVSDVPIGTFLSGGIDSPLVTAAASLAGRRVPAFTIGSDDPNFDESEAAAAYADAIGVVHFMEKIRASDCLGLIEDFSRAYSEPFADYSAFPTLLVSRLARSHVKVVLSGDGGDELFWGYPRFARVLSSRQWFRLPHMARWAVYAAGRIGGRARVPKGVTFPTIGDWYLNAHSGLRGREMGWLDPELQLLPADFDLYHRDRVGSKRELANWLRANELRGHLQMILLKVDRASMYYGLEVRVPLLDLELVDVAMTIWVQSCLNDSAGKLPLRRALACAVGPTVVTAEKRGFSVPLGDWLRKELRPLVEDLLLGDDTFPSSFLPRSALRRIYQEHLDGRDMTRGLWSLLALQLWAKEHVRPLVLDSR